MLLFFNLLNLCVFYIQLKSKSGLSNDDALKSMREELHVGAKRHREQFQVFFLIHSIIFLHLFYLIFQNKSKAINKILSIFTNFICLVLGKNIKQDSKRKGNGTNETTTKQTKRRVCFL